MCTIDRSSATSVGTIGSAMPSDSAPSEAEGADASLVAEPQYQWGINTAGDVGAELAALVLESAREDKMLSKEMRKLEEAAQQRAEEAQLEALEREANLRLMSGVIGGVGMISSGAAIADGAEGGGRICEGTSKLVAAFPEHLAGMANVDSTHMDQLAARHKRASDDARDAADDASELVDRAISFYKEYVTAQSDAQKAAIYRA